MKQRIILLFLSFLTCKITISQISFAFRLGWNIATTKDVIQFPKNRLGFYTGLASDISMNDKFSFIPELIYSSKGHRSTGNTGTDKMVLRLNYLNIPLSIAYKVDTKTKFLIGPELGYLLSSKLVIANNNLNVSKNYPQKFGIGALIGIKYAITNFCSLDIRYIYGFDQMYYVDDAGVRYTNEEGANRVFQLGLNLKLN